MYVAVLYHSCSRPSLTLLLPRSLREGDVMLARILVWYGISYLNHPIPEHTRVGLCPPYDNFVSLTFVTFRHTFTHYLLPLLMSLQHRVGWRFWLFCDNAKS